MQWSPHCASQLLEKLLHVGAQALAVPQSRVPLHAEPAQAQAEAEHAGPGAGPELEHDAVTATARAPMRNVRMKGGIGLVVSILRHLCLRQPRSRPSRQEGWAGTPRPEVPDCHM